MTGAPGDYGQIPKLGDPLPGDLGRLILAARENDETIPVPPLSAPLPDPRVEAAERARLHDVPLSDQVIALVESLKVIGNRGRFLFPSSHSFLRPICENTLNDALRRMG